MPRKSSPPPDTELTFEQAFAQLEEIVERLESSELTLDESVALFERGQVLAAQCAKLLDAAELKVKQLMPSGELEDFDPEDEE